jgi:hypothetical protein
MVENRRPGHGRPLYARPPTAPADCGRAHRRQAVPFGEDDVDDTTLGAIDGPLPA